MNAIYKLLYDKYDELYSLCNEIDNSIFTSPYSVIVKSRIFAEKISKEIARLENMSQLNELNLAERLNKLSYNGVFDRELNDYFYGIRKIGNKAAHEDVENELMLALQVHEYVYKITGWFIETYVNYNFKTLIYKSPKPHQHIDEKEYNRLI